MDELLEQYYANGARKLHNMVDQIFKRKYGGPAGKDMDEFYSVANDAFADVVINHRYDHTKGDFNGYLYGVLSLAIVDEFKRIYRDKRVQKIEVKDENGVVRKIPVKNLSLDSYIDEDEKLTLGDIIGSDYDIESDLGLDSSYDDNMERYLSSLSKIQRQIIEMKMDDIPVSIIKKTLNITDKEYLAYMSSARMNENIALLRKTSKGKEEYEMNMIPIDLTDNYRMDKIPLGSLLDDMRDGKINRKYISQRKALQWSERQKNKFLTRVLNNQPIPEIVICEQIVKGKKKSHLIDGLQRLSYSELFRSDSIVVKLPGAEFYEIPYREYVYDDDGNVVLDEDGDPKFIEKTFNVIGKKFSTFPQFLKDRFNKFNINVTTYFNCTDEQIAYHIRNYNNQEAMNKNQYEFTGILPTVGEKVRSLSDNHPFFKDDIGKFTNRNKIKGDLDRVVIEGIMTINFIEDWKKEIRDSIDYVNRNATDDMFEHLKNILDRLSSIIDKNVRDIFSVANSPIWFAVFDKFTTLGLPDEKFKEFIEYFKNNFDTLYTDRGLFSNIYKSRCTRDKSIVTSKIQWITKYMYEYFHVNQNALCETVEEFISQNVDIPIEEVETDLYRDTLKDLENTTIKDGSKLLDEKNQLSLLAMVAYSFKHDVDLDNWMLEYAKNNNTYFVDQKKNYLHMLGDFTNYMDRSNRVSA